jgi:hypothetical protein
MLDSSDAGNDDRGAYKPEKEEIEAWKELFKEEHKERMRRSKKAPQKRNGKEEIRFLPGRTAGHGENGDE